MNIEIHDINITDWTDVSTHDGVAFSPSTMSVNATINNVWIEHIMLRYIPITSHEEIIRAIKRTLHLNDSVEEKSVL